MDGGVWEGESNNNAPLTVSLSLQATLLAYKAARPPELEFRQQECVGLASREDTVSRSRERRRFRQGAVDPPEVFDLLEDVHLGR